MNTLNIPNVWKIAKIFPLLRHGKTANQSASCRPISMLPSVTKLMESIELTLVMEAVHLGDNQHYFQKYTAPPLALHKI